MPVMAYLAMDDARALTRADFVRLGLVTGPGKSDVLPYSARYMRDFEDRYCYDQFWNEERSGRPGTRFMSCGHGFAMVGDAALLGCSLLGRGMPRSINVVTGDNAFGRVYQTLLKDCFRAPAHAQRKMDPASRRSR